MSETSAANSPAGRQPDSSGPVVTVRDLVKHFPITRGIVVDHTVGYVNAVDDVTFDLHPRETLGLVGESGCGKSTVAHLLVGLEKPTSGTVEVLGRDLTTLGKKELRQVRRNIQLVMQDPYSSLNPRMTVGNIVAEPLDTHRDVAPTKNDRQRRVEELLDVVGLAPAHIHRYPHEFSGGQRQRIGIARALAPRPSVVICDEPVSALDVSVQAQIINLLEDLQNEFGLAYVFIAHDLSVVRHICDRVAVMYLGNIVELGTESEVYGHPTHPYTQALLAAVPSPDPRRRGTRRRITLEGDVPDPTDPPSGCRFRTRCWKAQEVCSREVPALEVRASSPHPSKCHFAEERDIVQAAPEQ